jgi:hypothetical protein
MQLGDESLLTRIYSLRPVRLTCDFYREYYAYNILLFEVFELCIQTIALQRFATGGHSLFMLLLHATIIWFHAMSLFMLATEKESRRIQWSQTIFILCDGFYTASLLVYVCYVLLYSVGRMNTRTLTTRG